MACAFDKTWMDESGGIHRQAGSSNKGRIHMLTMNENEKGKLAAFRRG